MVYLVNMYCNTNIVKVKAWRNVQAPTLAVSSLLNIWHLVPKTSFSLQTFLMVSFCQEGAFYILLDYTPQNLPVWSELTSQIDCYHFFEEFTLVSKYFMSILFCGALFFFYVDQSLPPPLDK